MAKIGRKSPKKAVRAAQPPVKPTPMKRDKRPMADAPRIGALSPEEFEASASAALGGRGWQRAFRAGTGLAQSTLTRYLRGIFPVPQHVAIIVEMLQTLRSHGLPIPEAFNTENRQN